MLKHTFIHLDGVGELSEKKFWKKQILTHKDAIEKNIFPPSKMLKIFETKQKIEEQNALYFYNVLPSKERWRLFGEFHNSVAYIDIETTGLYGYDDIITTIALYDGKTIKHYVHGKNLNDFKNDIKNYKLLVTYNGTNFDLPFIRSFLNIPMDYAHIDLRYPLKSLGYSGGLKSCEKLLGLIRDETITDIDGQFAIYLWKYFKRYKEQEALDTLLSYNIEDVLSLESLMYFVYNQKISNLSLPLNSFERKNKPKNPFIPNKPIVDKIKNGIEKHGYTYLTENQKIKPTEPSPREKYIQKKGDIMYAIPNMDFFKDDNNKKNIPSKAKTPWVFVKSVSNHYPETINKQGGKWLIFIPEINIDTVWSKIRDAMLSDELVRHAKCSTIIKNKHSKQNKTDCVICIYTYDYSDEADVFNVRTKLKQLGFMDKIYYKTDLSTLERNYSHNGNKKTWLYAE